MMVPVRTFEIESIDYAKFHPSPEAVGQDSLRIRLTVDQTVWVPNTDFHVENPALCTMAYLGVRPSTLDDAVGKDLPVVPAGPNDLGVPDLVINQGQQILLDADWIES